MTMKNVAVASVEHWAKRDEWNGLISHLFRINFGDACIEQLIVWYKSHDSWVATLNYNKHKHKKKEKKNKFIRNGNIPFVLILNMLNTKIQS